MQLGPLCILPVLSLAGGLVQGVSQYGVLLLQSGQLCVGSVLQLFLEADDLHVEGLGLRQVVLVGRLHAVLKGAVLLGACAQLAG